MKNILPIAAILGGGFFLINYFKRKARAGENLQFELLDIKIDTQRTLQSGLVKIFYTVKLNLINNENASIKIQNVQLDIKANNKLIGRLSQTINFTVPRESSKIIAFETSFFTVGIIGLVIDLVQNGLRANVNVAGFIQTDLGRVNVDFNKDIGASIEGSHEKKNSI